MKFYLVAGERSGDLHGGNLIAALRQKNPHYTFRGFGGECMQQAGMELVVHYRELAVMGFGEVVRHLGKIKKNLQRCKEDIRLFGPDAIVLIDFAGFNLRIAWFAKSRGIKVFWYIAPKVWAWNSQRALQLKRAVDHLFVILPFEKEFFHQFGWDVDYVGNPVLDAIKSFVFNTTFKEKNNLPDKTVAMLPGSRRQEVRRMAPVFVQMAQRFPDVVFTIPKVDNLAEADYLPFKTRPNIRVLSAPAYDILANACAAVVTSGTATLETALLKIPQVVVYKTGTLSYLIGRAVIKVPFISLVNLIAGRKVVTELIQHEANDLTIADELNKILHNSAAREAILKGYEEVYKALDTGTASQKTAELIVKYLQK